MEKFEGTAWNNVTGLPIASPTITVFHTGTAVAATIYADEGVTTKTNPFTGDAQGRFNFYAHDGDYDVQVAGAGATTYLLVDRTVSDKKRMTGLTDYEVYGLANAFYNRNTAAWNRRDTGRPAWSVQLDADVAEDYVRFLHATAAANPITWVELLRLNATGQLLAILGAVGTPSYSFTGDVNTGLYSPGADLVALAAGGVQILQAAFVASAVNYLRVRPAIATAPVLIDPQGTDTNIGLDLLTKGTGVLRLFTNALERFRVNNAFSVLLRQTSFDYTLDWANPGAARTISIADPGGNDSFAFLAASQVFTNKAGVPYDDLGATGSTNLATTGTEFIPIVGVFAPNATEANVELIAHGAGQLIGLRVRLSAAPTGGGNSHIFTLRINGADTAAVVTITDAATTGTWTGAVTVAAGDRLALKHTVAGTPAAATAQYATRRRESAV